VKSYSTILSKYSRKIIFYRLSTENQDDTDKIRIGSFIKSTAPANLTVTNSNFSMHYNSLENLHTFLFEDSSLCTPNDGVFQKIIFANNIVSYDIVEEGIYNNIYINYKGFNQREIEVDIIHNEFLNMWGGDRPLINLEFQKVGLVEVDYNYFYNWSAHDYLVKILKFEVTDSSEQTHELLIANNNEFKDWILLEYGLLLVKNTENIELHNFTISGTIHGDSLEYGSTIYITSANNGSWVIEGLLFYDNKVKGSTLEIEDTVGDLTIRDCDFHNEVLYSNVNYISIANPHTMMIDNLSFMNISDDHTDTEDTVLVVIKSIDLTTLGEIHFQYVTVENWTVSFFYLKDVYGTTDLAKIVKFKHLTVSNAQFDKHNDLISFGPLYTDEDVDIHIVDALFENLNFTKLANVIHLKQQSLDPFILEDTVFSNIQGGHILLEPLTVAKDSLVSKLVMLNVTASNNNFADSTFIVLKEHWEIIIDKCDFLRNSAEFRGTIISIIDNNSHVHIKNCKFNNNNGVIGGIFYISGKSTIVVEDSTFFGNFALTASIGYVTSQGSVTLTGCNIRFNHAISVGLLELIDSSIASSIIHSAIEENDIVSSATINTELDDISLWVNLWFASDQYLEHLDNNRELLDLIVTHALFSTTEATFNILEGVDIADMLHVSIGYAYHGHLTMDNWTIHNITLYSSAFILIGSDFSIDHTNVTSLSRDHGSTARFLQIELDSFATMNNTMFSDMTISIANWFSSEIIFTGVQANNISSEEYVIDWYYWPGVTFDKIVMHDWESKHLLGMIQITETTVKNIADSSFSECQLIVIIFKASNVLSFTGNTFDGFNKALSFEKKTNGTISNSIFKNFVQNVRDGVLFQSNIVSDGSAIGIVDSNIVVENCTFIENIAKNGGAISVYWNYLKPWVNVIRDWVFTNNTALVNGGAVVFNSYSPIFENNVYTLNNAAFGNDTSSYAAKIKEVLSDGEHQDLLVISNVPSGEVIDDAINLAIVDAEQDDIMVTDSLSTIHIKALDEDSHIEGQSTISLKRGQGSFTSTIFRASPGQGRSQVLNDVDCYWLYNAEVHGPSYL
jgi:hypothetical protein